MPASSHNAQGYPRMSDFVVVAIVAATACVCGVVVGPLVCKLVRVSGLVDQPDGRRKLHVRNVPLAGGPLILLVSFVVVGVWLVWDGRFGLGARHEGFSIPWLMVATCVMFGVGLVDDWRGLRGRVKLAGQMVSVLIAVFAGIRIDAIHVLGLELPLGPLAVPVTAVWLLGAVNAVNLLDGIDGMVGSMSVVLAGAMAVMAAWFGHLVPAVIAGSLAGSLAAFLAFNKPPARMFLGDSGSLTIGLLLGCMAVVCSLKGPATVVFSLPVTLLFLPLLDTAAAVTRRVLTGRSIFTTDRGHLHHRLLQAGLSHYGVLALVVGLNLLLAAGAVASLATQNDGLAMAAAALVATTLLVSRLFGVQEITLLRQRVESVFRLRWVSRLFRQPAESAVGVQLQGSSTGWERVVRHVGLRAEALRLDTVHLDVNAPQVQEGYFVHWTRSDKRAGDRGETWCQINLPLRIGTACVGSVRVTASENDRNRVEVVNAVLAFADELTALTEQVLVKPVAAEQRAELVPQAA